MFNKFSSEITMPNQIKPTPWVYVFYNLQGQSFVSQFFNF